jgi:peptide/nickel transport system ATP-binding protein
MMSQFESLKKVDLAKKSEPLLEIRDLEVEYHGRGGKTFLATDKVSLSVNRGETVGLVGESGSGKSSIAKAVLNMAPVRAGSIRLAGQDITNFGTKARRELGKKLQIVFQDPTSSLNPYLTVGSSLAEPLAVHGIRDEEARQRVAHSLKRVGLSPDAALRYPAQFSGGQRQRIAIARALMLDPQVVICDEAVSALDLSVQAQILNLLVELQQKLGLSYLFISHDIDVVRYISDRVVVLYQGQVMETGPTATVTTSPGHPYTKELLDAVPLTDPRAQRLRREEEERPRKGRAASSLPTVPVVSQGCPFAARCPYVIEVCRNERPPLGPTEDGGLAACHRYPEWLAL